MQDLGIPSRMQLASDGCMNPGKVQRNLAKKARRALRVNGQWMDVQDHTMAAQLAGGNPRAGKKKKVHSGCILMLIWDFCRYWAVFRCL